MTSTRWTWLCAAALLAGCNTLQGGPDGGAAAPHGTGERASGTIGEAGGSVGQGGAVLTLPAGAVGGDEEIAVTSTTEDPPDGYTLYSEIFLFEPEPLVLDAAGMATLPFSGDADRAAVFWSRLSDGTYVRLGGQVSGATITVPVTHLGRAFVGDGSDYAPPPPASRRDAGVGDAG